MAAHAMLVILGLFQQEAQHHTTLGRVLQSHVLPTLQGPTCRLDAHIHAALATMGALHHRLHRHFTSDRVLLSHVQPILLEIMFHQAAHAMRDTVGV